MPSYFNLSLLGRLRRGWGGEGGGARYAGLHVFTWEVKGVGGGGEGGVFRYAGLHGFTWEITGMRGFGGGGVGGGTNTIETYILPGNRSTCRLEAENPAGSAKPLSVCGSDMTMPWCA